MMLIIILDSIRHVSWYQARSGMGGDRRKKVLYLAAVRADRRWHGEWRARQELLLRRCRLSVRRRMAVSTKKEMVLLNYSGLEYIKAVYTRERTAKEARERLRLPSNDRTASDTSGCQCRRQSFSRAPFRPGTRSVSHRRSSICKIKKQSYLIQNSTCISNKLPFFGANIKDIGPYF